MTEPILWDEDYEIYKIIYYSGSRSEEESMHVLVHGQNGPDDTPALIKAYNMAQAYLSSSDEYMILSIILVDNAVFPVGQRHER